MPDIDIEKLWRELRETYTRMSDDEFYRIVENKSDLIPLAQEALQTVIAERGLKVLSTGIASAEDDESETDQSATDKAEVDPWYMEAPDELEKVFVRTVYNQEEAELVKSILDANFIASCLGPEEVVELKDFKGSFSGGVDFKALRRDQRLAISILGAVAPEPETEEEKEAENKEYAVVCPKCHSEEIIFKEVKLARSDETKSWKFQWKCCDCGHQWKDDGIAPPV